MFVFVGFSRMARMFVIMGVSDAGMGMLRIFPVHVFVGMGVDMLVRMYRVPVAVLVAMVVDMFVAVQIRMVVMFMMLAHGVLLLLLRHKKMFSITLIKTLNKSSFRSEMPNLILFLTCSRIHGIENAKKTNDDHHG